MCRSHLAPDHSDFPFPRDIFEKFVKENDGALTMHHCISLTLYTYFIEISSMGGSLFAVQGFYPSS